MIIRSWHDEQMRRERDRLWRLHFRLFWAINCENATIREPALEKQAEILRGLRHLPPHILFGP